MALPFEVSAVVYLKILSFSNATLHQGVIGSRSLDARLQEAMGPTTSPSSYRPRKYGIFPTWSNLNDNNIKLRGYLLTKCILQKFGFIWQSFLALNVLLNWICFELNYLRNFIICAACWLRTHSFRLRHSFYYHCVAVVSPSSSRQSSSTRLGGQQSVTRFQTMICNIPQDCNIHQQPENLKSLKVYIL